MSEHGGDPDADPLPWRSWFYLGALACFVIGGGWFSLRVFAGVALPRHVDASLALIGYLMLILFYIAPRISDGTG